MGNKNMTRKEQTGKRSLEHSGWIREKLSDPEKGTGNCIGNLDWIHWNYKTRRLILLEEKTHNAEYGTPGHNQWHKIFMETVMVPALEQYCPNHDIDFRGFHVIIFEGTCAKDGRIYLDNKEISEDELIRFYEGE